MNIDSSQFCNFDALYNSSYKVCRNIRWKDSTIHFENNRIENILKLQEELSNDEYVQTPFSCFSIVERGKPRDIRACHIYDRLLQNSLCENSLIPDLIPKFIHDNSATLKGRGIDFAIKRTKILLQRAYREYKNDKNFYCLRFDISKYFDNINHDSCKKLLKKYIKDENALLLTCDIIDSFCYIRTRDTEINNTKQYYVSSNNNYKQVSEITNKKKYFERVENGLGLGSQVSQLLALLALNEIDHLVKDDLKFKYYQRYMDDMFVLHNNKQVLEELLIKVQNKLSECGLELNPKKTIIAKIETKPYNAKYLNKHNPLKFLKWNFFITTKGKVIMIPFKEKLYKQRRRLQKLHKKWINGGMSSQEVLDSYRSWRSHLEKGNTYYVLRDMDKFFNNLFRGGRQSVYFSK